jgi:hypothetical protein
VRNLLSVIGSHGGSLLGVGVQGVAVSGFHHAQVRVLSGGSAVKVILGDDLHAKLSTLALGVSELLTKVFLASGSGSNKGND